MRNLSFVIALALAQISLASAQDKSIVVASTTSMEDSGLYNFILPLFKQRTGIDVNVVALGTGQALDMARRGDADVVLVHAREAEEKFIAEGFRVKQVLGLNLEAVHPVGRPTAWRKRQEDREDADK